MDSEDFPVVQIENGPVKGLKVKSVLNTEYFSFRGIPYMKAPLGKLRFREADSPRDWKEALDATQEGPSYCMTDFMTGVQDGQENAGTINIYSRSLKPGKLHPVMIWIHGGGYCRGSSRTDLYGPDYLIEKDVVVVSFNYRLGVIGFISFDNPFMEMPGNVGLKDQVFALKWIQKNIQQFGGDPKQCTIFGESAGGACVNYLTITNQTKGLFQRAIIISGSSFNKTWSLAPRKKQAERLAKILGWAGKNGDESSILDFLENVPAFELDAASQKLFNDEESFGYGLLVPFAPVIEQYETDNCIINKEPVEMARETWMNENDIMVVGCSFEGILRAFSYEDVAASVLQNPSFFAPLLDLGMNSEDLKAKEYGEKVKKIFYKNGEEPSVDNQEQYLRFNTDIHFWHGLYRLIQSRKAYASGKTFLMYFDVDADLNMFKALKNGQKFKGACHADDLFYLFTTVYHDPPASGTKEFETIRKYSGMITSFAKTGGPNCDEIPHLDIQPIDGSSELECILITSSEVSLNALPIEENMKVFDSIYDDRGIPLY